MNVLDGMPTLSAGSHKPNSGKACVMEYVSLLSGESWSDQPACTHLLIAEAAKTVNDYLLDSDRHLLVPMIVRLFGTDASVDDDAFYRVTGELFDKYRQHRDGPPFVTRPPEMSVQFLSDVIDIYDRLSGRNETYELTDADMALLNSVSAT